MPFTSRPELVAVSLVYLALVLLIGIWSARRTRTARDFWIAGQSAGLWVTGLATAAATFSGFVFIGGPGLMYRQGMGSLFIVIPAGFTAALMCWTVGKRLRLLSGVHEVFTIPDAIFHRYRSRTASGLAALAVIVGTLAYLGSQFLAMGRLIEIVFDMRRLFGSQSLLVAMAGGVAVMVVYSALGGMVAGVYTDVFQGLTMTVVAVAVFFFSVQEGGGLARLSESISTSELFGPEFLDPFGTIPVFTAAGYFFVFSIGSLGQPHVLHKFFMLDDPRKLKWFPLVVGTTQSLCILIWFGIGLAIPALVAQGRLAPLAQPDDAAPLFLAHFASPLLAGLAFAGILAAIMSTADSFVNIGSAAIVRDLPKAFGGVLRHELFWGRLAVVGIALSATGLAWLHGDLVALLGTLAFGTFGAALAPVIAVGFQWKRVDARAASASMLVGLVSNVTLELLARSGTFVFASGVLPTAVSLAASVSTLLLFAYAAEPKNHVADPHVNWVMDS